MSKKSTQTGAARCAQRRVYLVSCLLAIFPLAMLTPLSAQARENHVKTRLVADVQSIEPGQAFRIGVVFAIEDHAHIYWRNPGSSGIATEIDWDVPQGFITGPLQWPTPNRFEIPEIHDISYGYETQTFLFSGVRSSPESERGETLRITATAKWLICLESGQCIPEQATLHLDLSIGKNAPSKDTALFDIHIRRLPHQLSDRSPVTLERKPGQIIVTATRPWRLAPDAHPLFFPNHGEAWNAEAASGAASITFNAVEPEGETTGGILEIALRNDDDAPTKHLFIAIE